jgi:signal transduction histidine kinase
MGGEFERELRRAAEQGAPLTFEAPFPDDRWFEVRAFPREDGLTAYLRDVTERRRSQEVQANLLGIVGHDLRTPITSILISAGAIARDPKVPERHLSKARRIESVAEHMTRLIQDLLDYSRARLGQGLSVHPAEVDLDDLCRNALDQIRAAHGERTVVYHHEGDGRGRWDPDRILQVLLNLLTNALRYGTPEGEVVLSWRGEADRKILSVHNHGPAISPALLGQIFEPGKRGEAGKATRGSVGLGLYIVKQIAAAHGGAVTVRSSEREGTTFEVVLPARTG